MIYLGVLVIINASMYPVDQCNFECILYVMVISCTV